MPRPHSASSSKRKTTAPRAAKRKSAAATRAPIYECPECGKEFTRPASLGAHRNRAHGVTGTSSHSASSARRRPTSRKASNSSTARTRSFSGVNRDALLQALFPQGIPAKEQIIRDVNAWLDQAERLARQA
jgi:uncharacterized C2H2 Zn-finger protein